MKLFNNDKNLFFYVSVCCYHKNDMKRTAQNFS